MTTARARQTESGYSRITLVGSSHRADLVLPSSEPVGVLFADMIAVLDERLGSARMVLMTATGALIPAAASLAEAGIADGAVLRVVAEESAPPPPVVNDVTEETAGDTDARGGRWSQRTSAVFAITGTGVAAASLVWETYLTGNHRSQAGGVSLLVAGMAAWLLAVGSGWGKRIWACLAGAVAGGVLIGGGLLLLGLTHHWTVRDEVGVLLAAGWVAVGVATTGRRRNGDVFGAVLGAGLAAAWIGLAHTAIGSARADALVAVAAVLVCGLLPRWALTVSGLASLDDARLMGAPVRRKRLRRSLRDAHAALVASTTAVAVMITVCGVLLAATGRAWPVAVAGAAALVIVLRSRTLPLPGEAALLLGAAAAVSLALLTTWVLRAPSSAWPMAVTTALLVGVYGCVWLRPARHVRARLRNVGDRVEAVAVLALVPVCVGVFGVYGALLNTFTK